MFSILQNSKLLMFLLVAYVFFIPISTSLMNIFLYLALILIILNKDLIKNIKISWKNNASKFSILIFLFVTLGSLWSIGDSKDILEGISTYKKFIFVFLMLPFLVNKKNNELLINSFFISMSFILLLVYSIFLDIMQPINIQLFEGIFLHVSESGGFKTHIITNILFAFFSFMSIHRFFDSGKVRYLFLGIFSLYYSIFINDGTTGQILSISLLSVLTFQKLKYKTIFVLPIILLGIFFYGANNENTAINHAINKIHTGLNNYESGSVKGSPATRLALATNGLIIIKENPWIGTGTGSINQSHVINVNKFTNAFKYPSKVTNPHSEYLSIAIQYGLIGLLLYLFLIYKLFKCTKQLPNDFYKHSAQGLLVLIVIGSFGTSIITDSGEGHLIMLFAAILFAPLSNQETKKTDYL